MKCLGCDHENREGAKFCNECAAPLDPDKIDVNVRCLDEANLADVHPRPFDGRHWDDAMAALPPLR